VFSVGAVANGALLTGVVCVPGSSPGGEIQKLLISNEIFKNARTVGIYVHCAKLREVDTSSLLENVLAGGKRTSFLGSRGSRGT